MSLRTSDVVPISEAHARLTELAAEVVDGGAEKVLAKNGTSYVAIIDAKKLDYYHALEERKNMPAWCCWMKPRPACGRHWLDSACRLKT